MKVVIVAHNGVVWDEVEFSSEDLSHYQGIDSILAQAREKLERLRDKDNQKGERK